MASLTDKRIKNTYDGLLKTTDNDPLGGSYKLITDGLGNSSNVYLGTGGNVGIGTTSPVSPLHVNSTGVTTLRISTSSSSSEPQILLIDGANDYFSIQKDDQGITFKPQGSEAMRIDSSGNVGIGTSGPSAKLDIRHVNSSSPSLRCTDNSGDTFFVITPDSNTVFEIGDIDQGGGGAKIKGTYNDILILDGNCGIGTTSPVTKLHIADVTTPTIRIEDTTNNRHLQLFHDNNNSYIRSSTGSQLRFQTNGGNDRMVITTSGDVGIGTTSPTSPLTVKSNSTSASDSGITIQANANTNPLIKLAEKAGGKARFHMYNAGVEKIAFYTDGTDNHISEGNVGIGTSNPTEKLTISSDNPIVRIHDSSSTTRYAAVNFATAGGSWFLSSGDNATSGTSSNLFITRGTDGTSNRFIFHRDSYYFGVYDNTNTIKTVIRANGVSYFNGGNVGIGTTSPGEKLSVGPGDNVSAEIGKSLIGNIGISGYAGFKHISLGTNNYALLQSSSGQTFLNASSTESIRFRINNADKMTLTNAGNVGIGTTGPSFKLDVIGDGIRNIRSTAGWAGWFQNNASSSGVIITAGVDSGDAPLLVRKQDTTEIFSVRGNGTSYFQNGNVGIGTTSPSAKLHAEGDGSIIRLQNNNSDANGTFIDFRDSTGTRTGYVGTTGTSDDMFLYTQGAKPIRFYTNATERMRIDSSGNVGIGTVSPAGKLEVNGGTGVATSGGTLIVRQDGDTLSDGIALTSSNAISHRMFKNASGTFLMGPSTDADAFALDLNGNVGIGTSSPARLFHVKQSSSSMVASFESASGANSFICFSNTASTADQVRIGSTSGNLILSTNYSERLRINSSGNVGIGTTSPSAKLEVNGEAIFNTNTGTTPFYVTRQGTTGEALSIKVTDQNVRFESIQDEPSDGFGGFDFRMDSGTNEPDFIIRKGSDPALFLVNGGGNVGIGTTSPNAKLEVMGGVDKQLRLSTGTTTYWELGRSTSTGHFEITEDSGDTYFLIDKDNGNVGIGTTSPGEKLHVFTSSNTVGKFETSLTSDLAIELKNSQGSMFFGLGGGEEFAVGTTSDLNGTGNLFVIRQNGNVGIGAALPSTKLDVNGSASFNNAVVVDGLDTGNPIPPTNQTRISGYGMIGNRGSFYITNGSSNGTIYWGIGSNHNGATKMTLRNTGNLGIGTTAPNTKLEVGDCESSGNIADGNIAVKTKSNNTAIVIQEASGAEQWGLGVNVDGDLIFTDSGTERIRFDDGTGNVGIGTSSPSQVLHAKANDATLLLQDSTTSFSSQASGIILTCSDGSGNARTDVQYKLKVNSTNFEITYGSSNAQRFKIEQDGGLFVPSLLGSSDSNPLVRYNTTTGELYYNSSSIRYKEDVTDIESTIDKINKLRPVKFKVKESQQYTTGLIAEEVVEVIPELTFKNKVEGFDEPQIDGVSYGDLPTYLLKAIQEQQEMINELKTEIQTLKSQINS